MNIPKAQKEVSNIINFLGNHYGYGYKSLNWIILMDETLIKWANNLRKIND